VRILAVAAASFVMHATPTVQQFGEFNITHDPTLRGLTKVCGPFDDCTKRAWFSWRSGARPDFACA
jgi:hypothetical protein